MIHRLDKLLLSEISLVDDPANQLPGWVVMKNRGGAASTSSAVAPVSSYTEARRRIVKAAASEPGTDPEPALDAVLAHLLRRVYRLPPD